MGFLERTAEMFDLPADVLAGQSHIEIIGGNEFFIENHHGIIEYTDEEVKLNLGKKILRLTGVGLVVESMNENELRMRGKIINLEFIDI